MPTAALLRMEILYLKLLKHYLKKIPVVPSRWRMCERSIRKSRAHNQLPVLTIIVMVNHMVNNHSDGSDGKSHGSDGGKSYGSDGKVTGFDRSCSLIEATFE